MFTLLSLSTCPITHSVKLVFVFAVYCCKQSGHSYFGSCSSDILSEHPVSLSDGAMFCTSLCCVLHALLCPAEMFSVVQRTWAETDHTVLHVPPPNRHSISKMWLRGSSSNQSSASRTNKLLVSILFSHYG